MPPSEAGNKYEIPNESAIDPRGSCKGPFRSNKMQPFLSPRSLSREEGVEQEQEYSSMIKKEYLSISTNSLDQWQDSNVNLRHEPDITVQPPDLTSKATRPVFESA